MRKKVFDAIMYRIIERGGERVGPKRGFLFAKEFGISSPISTSLKIPPPTAVTTPRKIIP